VISMAEHNGNYSTALKNIFDCVTWQKFQEKPMLC
jgi:NAD(P)H-dependent FMN reductase